MMTVLNIHILRAPDCEDLPLPQYQSEGASGLDLFAAVEAPLTIPPKDYALVSTGIRLSIPKGYEGQVRPRSGLALKHGIGILNTPGTIDSDYRGIVGVILFNLSESPFTIQRGDRIAQLVIAKTERITWRPVQTLDGTERESGGFGSTGKD